MCFVGVTLMYDLGRICGVVFAKGGFGLMGNLTKFKKSVGADPTLLHPFRASRKKFIDMKNANPSLHLSKTCDALAPPRKVEAERSEFDELTGPQDQFLETWRYERQFGKADPKKIVEQTFRGKTMKGLWVIPTEEQGRYTRSRKSAQGIRENTTLCDMELTEGQADATFSAAMNALLASKDSENESIILCSLGDGATLAVKDIQRLSMFRLTIYSLVNILVTPFSTLQIYVHVGIH